MRFTGDAAYSKTCVLMYIQKQCSVKWLLAIELLSFSKTRQTRYHLKELSERNLFLDRDVKFCLLKGALIKFCSLSSFKPFNSTLFLVILWNPVH